MSGSGVDLLEVAAFGDAVDPQWSGGPAAVADEGGVLRLGNRDGVQDVQLDALPTSLQLSPGRGGFSAGRVAEVAASATWLTARIALRAWWITMSPGRSSKISLRPEDQMPPRSCSVHSV